MAFTSAQIQAILDQLYAVMSAKAGIASVQFEGRVIRYSSLDEVTKAIRYWEGRLGRINGTRPAVMQHNLSEFD